MQINILHYKPLTSRMKFMLDQIVKHKLQNVQFIEDHDREVLTNIQLSKFNTMVLKLSEISLAYKHIEAWKQQTTNYNLILEDDAELCEDFGPTLEKYIQQLPEDYDMLFIGDGCNLHIPKSDQKTNQYIYPKTLLPTKWGGNGARTHM